MLADPASQIRISEWCDDDQANLYILNNDFHVNVLDYAREKREQAELLSLLYDRTAATSLLPFRQSPIPGSGDSY